MKSTQSLLYFQLNIFFFKVCTGSVILASVIQYERLRGSVKQINAFEFYRNSIRKNEVNILTFCPVIGIAMQSTTIGIE